jgi:hypothetical protein
MFTKAESAQPYIYSIFTPAGNCCSFSNRVAVITPTMACANVICPRTAHCRVENVWMGKHRPATGSSRPPTGRQFSLSRYRDLAYCPDSTMFNPRICGT